MMAGQFQVGFTTLKEEIVCDALPVRGTLPSWLSGTLLRTGPAQFEVEQHPYRHWFDGLAMLHRFSFHAGTVSYANRFLHSKTYQENKEAGKITYGEFATDPCRSLFKRLVTTFIQDLYLENLIGPNSRAVSQGELRRYRIPLSGAVGGYEVLSQESFDLPRINYQQSNGRDYRFAYGSGRRKETPDDFMNQLVKVDIHKKETQRWFEEDCYPGEAIFVATPNATREDEGVLLSVVLDGKKGTSFLLVLDATTFRELARAEVPHYIPFSFHGMYTASSDPA